jgi:glutamyl-tRNA synthetase
MARTALFSWAYARHHGGTFVFRIEDTDAARDSEDSYKLLIDVMRWLRLDWDEGPEVGGPHGPYRQSQRLDVYADVAAKLMGTGAAYRCYCTTAEVDERRRAADAGPTGYDNHCRELSGEQVAGFEAEGRAPVLRMRMPEHAITFTDLVRGEITFSAEHVPDYVLVRANGQPLYTLVNPVDDALMGITHVCAVRICSAPLHGRSRCTRRSRRSAWVTAPSPSSGTCRTSWDRATRSCPSAIRSPTCWRTATRVPAGGLAQLSGVARMGDR